MITNNLNAAKVKNRASGQWTHILPALTGIDATLLDEKHHPCPKCGGKDRFRSIDTDAGALYCNQCFNERNGDGITAVMWLNEWSFPESLHAVAGYLNLPGSRNGHASNGHVRGATAGPTVTAKAKGESVPKGNGFATAVEAVADACRWMSKDGFEPGGEWLYHSADGKRVATVLRFNHPTVPKQYRPVSLHGDRWFTVDPPQKKWPLYRLPELANAELVFVDEGEQASDTVRSIGLTATTSAHGSQSPKMTDWSPLAGKPVVILPDNDDSGEKYAELVTTILLSLDPPATVQVVRLPDIPKGGDMVEGLAAQPHTADNDAICDALLKLVEAAEPVVLDVPVTTVDQRSADDESETTNIIDEPWPAPLHDDALHGVVGDIVRLIEPHSEADPVALLIQLLVVIGNIVGRYLYFQVESTRHYANLYAVLVGSSSSGRKGYSGRPYSQAGQTG